MVDVEYNIAVAKRKEKLQAIIDSYQANALPLLLRLEKMQGYIPVNCLNEIRALNDHVARCFRDSFDSDNVEVELSKSMGHVERLVLDCFKQLIIFVKDDIQSYEKKYFSTLWYYWNDGEFWKEYCNLKVAGEQLEIDAKIKETADKTESLRQYEQAYQKFQKISDLLSHQNLRCSQWNRYFNKVKKMGFWLMFTLITTIVVSIGKILVNLM